MNTRITVNVVEFRNRKYYQLQWQDPITGRKKTRSSGIERTGRKKERDKAVAAAGVLQEKLETGKYVAPTRTTWDGFRDRYDREHLSSLAEGTRNKVDAVFNTLERILNPSHLRSLTTERLSHYQAILREQGRSENTIAGHLAHVGAALNWAAEMGLLAASPKIKRPRRAKSGKMMKGRAIATEEFERMLDNVAAGLMARSRRTHKKNLVEDGERPQQEADLKRCRKQAPAPSADVVAAWQQYLHGLWLSGLRLGESLELSWDDSAGLWIDLSGKFPVMRILAESEKGHEDRLLPICPDFAEYLTAIPETERSGRVFKLPCRRGDDRQLGTQYVSAIVGQIGEAAGVVVHRDHRTGRVKFASAHDLRRSFGERWARKVMPIALKELMRHESIETTLKFYVRDNAEMTARAVWDSCGASWQASGGVVTIRDTAPRPGDTPSQKGKSEVIW